MNLKIFVTAILLFHYAFSTYNGLSKKDLTKKYQFPAERTGIYGNRFESLGGESDEEDEEFAIEEEKEKLNATNRLIQKEIYDLIDEKMEEWTQLTIEIQDIEEKIQKQKEEKKIMIEKERINKNMKETIETEIGNLERKFDEELVKKENEIELIKQNFAEKLAKKRNEMESIKYEFENNLRENKEEKNRLMSEEKKLKDMIQKNTDLTENDERFLWIYTEQSKILKKIIDNTVSEQIEAKNYTYIHNPEQFERDYKKYVGETDKIEDNNINSDGDSTKPDSRSGSFASVDDLEDVKSEYDFYVDIEYEEGVNFGEVDKEDFSEEVNTNIVFYN